MAEEGNPSSPVESGAEIAETDGMAQGAITIGQFWDENPLIMSWMDGYLPRNRMWKDAIFTGYNCFFSIAVICILSKIFLLPDKVVLAPGITLIFWDSYLLAKLNQRMARAQGKFIRAKLNERPFSERIRIGARGIKEWLNP
ncbi:hypothetical protein EN828_04670 [Mesorhizobium sp. M2D.F.Ca.ET.185.01.1.1]|uniref:hypothetical protein n=1 Tax=unclassified Mesorhizobium TaxID=325217 RepID=UPI000FCAEED9|nr:MULTISPECIES: hypothetical protein [unclassified Mesorhizobium]TGP77291.1 hypothetical protein EN870_18705 [bacterium M00.F.Ca.ET.227.01.1.1]TGP93084.1 hypothetical protein EN865_18900 [bacterium M00.F.Ca.ET.222.01.1.1]TGP96630.1 hypothetical protein EN864_09185 [bacterium M00.F.Ca.ET.221.01.1.1]TGT95002.1 hypothetical protein EN806_54270 [bacterium M00.F.Ca.ET.163.01.1.1]TGU20739.1 hypothetical protein EN799_55250 [bacterium M00.F.Ca.ET.156.01.1.1]TGU49842.1 hypothetical protein EN789_045